MKANHAYIGLGLLAIAGAAYYLLVYKPKQTVATSTTTATGADGKVTYIKNFHR